MRKKGSDRPDIHDGIGITSTKHFFVRTSDRRCRAMLPMTEQRDEQPSFCQLADTLKKILLWTSMAMARRHAACTRGSEEQHG